MNSGEHEKSFTDQPLGKYKNKCQIFCGTYGMDAADLCKKILNLYYRRQLIDQVSENYLLERKIRLQFSSAVEDLMISDLPQSPFVEVTTAESISESVHVSLGELHSRIKYVQKHVIPTIPNVERVTASPEPQQPQSLVASVKNNSVLTQFLKYL